VKVVLACLAIMSGIGFSGVRAWSEPETTEAELDRRVYAFSREVRCLVCQNETLADSRAGLALDLRREIREQMKAGKSDEEITAFLTDRYGDFVLYRPPLKPSTYPLWFGPFVLLAIGLFALYRALNHWRTLPDVEPLSAKERRRIRQRLDLREEENPAR
jgi:cytochrome c-type biogenesis protein CcmH